MNNNSMEPYCRTFIDMQDMLNDCLVCKEKALIHQRQIEEICRIICRRMEDNNYNPKEKYRSQNDVISIFARRGAGKTTFVKSLINEMKFCREDRFHGVPCGQLVITEVIEPNQVQKKENFMVRFLAAIHSEFKRLIEKKSSYSEADTKPFENATYQLFEALPVVDGVGKLELYSDWDDSEYVASKFMNFATKVKELESRFHKYIYEGLRLLDKKFLLFTLDDCDVNVDKTFEILETIRLYFTSPQVIVVMTGDSSLYGMTVRRNYWQFFGKEFLEKECDMSFDNQKKLKEYHKMVSRLETQYLQKMIKPEHRIVLDNVYEKYRHLAIETNGKQDLIVVKFSNGEEVELKDAYYKTLIFLGLVKAKSIDADIFIDHLLKQPFRNQYRILSIVNEWLKNKKSFDGEATEEEKQELTDKFLNVFEVYINLYSADNKYLMSKTPIYSAWIVKFLIDNNILNIGSRMMPVLEDGSLNNALMALSASCTRQIEFSPSIAFDFWIRISFVHQVLQLLDMKNYAEFYKFTNLYYDSGVCKITGDIHAFASAKSNVVVGIRENAKKTDLFGSFEVNETLLPDDNGIKGKLIKLIQLTTVATNTVETHLCSFYRLLAVMAELWRVFENKDGISAAKFYFIHQGERVSMDDPGMLKNKLEHLCQVHSYFEPTTQTLAARPQTKQEEADKRIQKEDSKSVTDFVEELFSWMTRWYHKAAVPAYSLDRIFTRMYYTFKDIDNTLSLYKGDRMSYYVIAFWNACIVEENEINATLGAINLGHEGDIVGIFIENYRHMKKYGPLNFAMMLTGCPLLRSYVDPVVLAMMELPDKELSLNDYYLIHSEKRADRIMRTINDLNKQIEEIDQEMAKQRDILSGISLVDMIRKRIEAYNDEIDHKQIALAQKEELIKRINEQRMQLMHLEQYIDVDEREVYADLRGLRMQKIRKSARITELQEDKDLKLYDEQKQDHKYIEGLKQKVKTACSKKYNDEEKYSVYELLSSL